MTSTRTSVLVAALALTIATTSLPASASPRPGPDPTRPSGTGDLLPRALGGVEAVRALGGRIEEVAALNDVDPAALRSDLVDDGTLRVDRSGHLFYGDPGPRPADRRRAARAAAAASPALSPYSYSLTFALHSRPTSKRTIYLDFTGHTVRGTFWNSRGVSTAPQPAYDTNGAPGTLTLSERDDIMSIWQRVAEDYAPFNVDVTTQDPGQAAITRSGAGDDVFGTRVLITNSPQAQRRACPEGAPTCGGAGYFGVFDETTSHAKLQPAWVFADGTGTDAKYLGDTASHEAGHNLGLGHDGTARREYYDGHANWAPIMGYGGQRAVTQWSNGRYPGAVRKEGQVPDVADDLAVIARNGAPRLTDDNPNTSTDPALSGPPFPAYGGVVERAGDVDSWQIGTCSGAVTVSAQPTVVSPNLQLQVVLRRPGGANGPIAGGGRSGQTNRDTATGLGATWSGTLSGRWAVSVRAVGSGPMSTSFDTYGSLGRYSLETTGCVLPAAPTVPRTLTGVRRSDGTGLTVTWDTPASPGGSAIAAYRVVITPVGQRQGRTVELPASARSAVFTGLPRETTYDVSVRAVNARTYGPMATARLRTAGRAAPPSNGDAVRDGSRVRVTWSAPADDGGSAVTGYEVRLDGGAWVRRAASQTSHDFLGVSPAGHRIDLRTINGVGTGAAATLVLAGARTASAPRDLRVAPGRDRAAVTWSAPADDGAATVTGYEVLLDDSLVTTTGPDARTATVTGLARGESHRVAVRAVNAVGAGALTARALTLPFTRPTAPRGVVVSPGAPGGRTTVGVRWSPPSDDGGTALTRFVVVVLRLDARGRAVGRLTRTAPGSARALVLRAPAGRHRVVVRAGNREGLGAPTRRSRAVRSR